MAEFYELAQAELKSAGYVQYEISNWAKPGFTVRHNLKYWRREPHLGFGAKGTSFSGTRSAGPIAMTPLLTLTQSPKERVR